MTALSTIVCASCLAASSAGCHGPRRCGPSVNGYAAGPGQADCPAECDRYAGRTYRRFECCRPRRDPRIPGPRIVSTLPAPEREEPGYLYPVPTYPVFGPRSEEPDGIEPELQPMSPGMEGEPLPPPSSRRMPTDDMNDDDMSDDDMSDDLSANEDIDDSDEESGELQLAAPQQLMQHAGWKPARRLKAPAEAPARPGAKRSITFRQPSSPAR